MLILLDVDGPLTYFLSVYLQIHNRLHECDFRPEHVTDFDFTKCVATKGEDEAVWREIDRLPGLIRGLGWVDGAERGLAFLRTLGRVVAVTSPHHGPYWMHERTQWLSSHGFKRRDIVHAADKALIPGDVLIDDKIENIEEWAAAWPSGRPIIFDALYNRRSVKGATRCLGWAHVQIEVERIAKEHGR